MKKLTIPALDDYPLGAVLHMASARRREGTVVMAAATATPQRFYRGFAEFLNAQGLDVLTFDYRGVGDSRPVRMRGFQAGFLDWGERDIPGVLAWAAERGPIDLIGHSYGGQALGLLPQPERVRSLCTFGTGSGHHSYMPRAEQVKVLAIWHLLGPVATSLAGYLPGRMLGLGEDLPLGAYRDWKRWCGFPRYWFDDPRLDFAPRFAAVKTPICAISSEDDRWAPKTSVDMFMSHYQGARIERQHLVPSELGLAAIGHLGFFRRENGPKLWPRVVEWLDRQTSATRVGVPNAMSASLP